MNPRPHDDGFDDAIKGYDMTAAYQPGHIDAQPYGPAIPAQSIPVKPGLTRRGKTALAIGTVVLATGGFISWQHYQAVSSANQARAEEIQYKKDLLALETLKEMNKNSTATQETQNKADAARQKQVNACVTDNKNLVEKQVGTTLESIIEACQTQYQATTSSADMQAAANSTDTGSSSGGGVNDGLLIGGAVLVGGFLLVARRGRTAGNAA